MIKTFTKLLSAAVLASACGSAQTAEPENVGPSDRELENAAETRWNAALTEDGGLMVKLRQPALTPEQARAARPAQEADLLREIERAAESQIDQSGTEGFRDINVKIDRPGVVKIDGRVNSELEAVRVIDAALGVSGVETVIAYLRYPGSDDDYRQIAN